MGDETREATYRGALERIRDWRVAIGSDFCNACLGVGSHDERFPCGIAARALAAPVTEQFAQVQPARRSALEAATKDALSFAQSWRLPTASARDVACDATRCFGEGGKHDADCDVGTLCIEADRAAQPSDTVGAGLVPVAEVVRWLELQAEQHKWASDRAANDGLKNDAGRLAGEMRLIEYLARRVRTGTWCADLAALDAATKETT